MHTRATCPLRMDAFKEAALQIVHEEVYMEVKFDCISSEFGFNYPINPSEQEKKRQMRLKKYCYRACASRLKTIGAFSSQMKKQWLISGMTEAAENLDEWIVRFNSIDPAEGVMSRDVLSVSILRALINGLQKMRLSDGQMGPFDDSE